MAPLEGLSLEVMLAAWPALEREQLGEWTLRFSGGFTRRANSVLPVGDPGVPLEVALERCEASYAARGLQTRFQLREGHTFERVEELLHTRGYRPEYPAILLAGALPEGVADPRVSHRDAPTPEWMDTWLEVSRRDDPAAIEFAREILARVSRPRSFAFLRDEGRVVATALGTLTPGWLGLSCLAVHEHARRRGLARVVIAALAAWSRRQGATGLWLEVEGDNAAALALYRELRLRRFGGHRYLTAPSISRTGS